VIEIELTQIQRTLYKATLDDNADFLLHNFSKNAPNLLNICMQLRKICNHPFLINGVEDMSFTQYLQMKNFKEALKKSST
jgi:chromodomain-helicase-DNA-binding protein 7